MFFIARFSCADWLPEPRASSRTHGAVCCRKDPVSGDRSCRRLPVATVSERSCKNRKTAPPGASFWGQIGDSSGGTSPTRVQFKCSGGIALKRLQEAGSNADSTRLPRYENTADSG